LPDAGDILDVDAATILTFAGILAFAPAAMLALGVVAFVRTLRLRAALVRAHARIDALEAALAGGGAAAVDAPAAAPIAQPAPQAAPQPVAAAPPPIPPPPLPPPPPPEPRVELKVAALAPPPPRNVEPAAARASADWLSIGVAAGLTLLYAAIWAATQAAATPLIPAPAGLGLMAALGVAALALSLRLGPWFVLLGLALANAAPALVALARPAPAVLFTYLAAVAAAALAIVRLRDWRLLSWFALAAALVWPGLWLALAFNGTSQIAVSTYIAAIAALAAAFGWTGARDSLIAAPNEGAAVAGSGIIGASLMLLGLTHVTGHGVAPSTALFALAIAAVAAAVFREGLAFAAIGAVGLGIAALIDWPALPPASGIGPHIVLGLSGLVGSGGALAFAASIGGWMMMARHARPVVGASLAALAPPLILAALFWKADGFGPAWGWSLTALSLAGLMAATMAQIVKTVGRTPGATGPTGAFAIGAATAAAFAVGFTLHGFPLGAGLALIAPACAWFDRQYNVPALKACAAIAAACAVILLLPPLALFHTVAATPLLNEILPSYVVAAGALILAARLFDQTVGRDDTLLVQTLEAAGLLLVAVLLSAEVRHLVNGGALTAPYAQLAEVGGHSIVWLCYALALAWRFGAKPRPLLFFAEAIAFGAAMANAAIMGLVVVNPWWGIAPAASPGVPVANALALAYGAPALLLAGYAVLRASQGMVGRSGAAAGAAALLAFVNVTLEVRRFAHGADNLQSPPIGIGEGWAMLAAWGALAAALVLLGLWRRSRLLVLASLAIAIAAAVKGFLFDAPALEGLTRALAFFALAAAALLLAFGYMRALGPRPATAPVFRPPTGDPNLAPPQDMR